MNSVLDILHPAHVTYLTHILPIDLDALFMQLDSLDPDTCEVCLQHAVLWFETLNYEELKNDCARILKQSNANEHVLASSIIGITLTYLLFQGDISSIDEKVSTMRKSMDTIASDVDAGTSSDANLTRKMFTPDFFERSEALTRAIPERVHNDYAMYQYFCENVLRPLLLA